MTQRAATFRMDVELLEALKAVQVRDGVPQSEQVRRALRAWLQDRGVLAPTAPTTKAARKRVSPRKRA